MAQAAVGIPRPAEAEIYPVLADPDERTATMSDRTPLLPSPDWPEVDEPAETEPGFETGGITIATLFLVAGALVLTQIPYGRIGSVVFATVGLVLGAIACSVADRRSWLPMVGTILHGVLLLVVVFAPTWLGMKSWRPVKVADESKSVRAFGPDGFSPVGDWLDTSKAWQFDDIRVKITMLSSGSIELTNAEGKRKWSKAQYLYVRVQVANVGVARPLEFPGWSFKPTKPGDPVLKLIDSAGRGLSQAESLEAGWSGPGRGKSVTLLPTETTEQTLLFELPIERTEYLRLELPGATLGLADAVRFQMSATGIPARAKGSGP